MRSRTAYPDTNVPGGAAKTFAHSNATRLLSAGAYLEKWYRKRVINELVDNQFRVVAPSNGYDAVTVLAHALAARSLRRKEIGGVIAGLVIDLVLLKAGVIGPIGVFLLAFWVLWAFAFLRRVATFQALTLWLNRSRDVAAHDSGRNFPATPALTARLAEKITREQACATGRIFYGGYRPFVGAGLSLPDWSTAELLVPEKPNALAEYVNRNTAYEQQLRPPELDPFCVDEITDYVARRLAADLRDDLPYGEQVPNLTVERRRYCRAGTVPIQRRWLRPPVPLQTGSSDAQAFRLVEDRERYDATREYLCVRIGAWDEELVVSIYLGFDLRGNTLYSEFFPYVLGPVVESFHLVDRLPESLTFGLLLRMAWDVSAGLPRKMLRAARGWTKRARSWMGTRDNPTEPEPVADESEFRLGRYTVEVVDRGAQTSVREIAASDEFRHFFQQTDSGKYIKIIERRLLQIIREFLAEHHVDLGEHDARGTTILDASTHTHGDISVKGHAKINFGDGRASKQGPSRGQSGS
jgi:hypothetical protein